MKKFIFVVSFFALPAFAGTMEQVTSAQCASVKGSYLRIDRMANTLQTQFANLPALVNQADGELMPFEIQYNEGSTELMAFAVNHVSGVMGSVALAAKTGVNLSASETLLAIFRDMSGDVQTENLTCQLKF